MKITINAHSSIRIESDKIIYFDPFLISETRNDADIIFITHDHFDHFSLEDIKKVEKESTVYVIPDNMYNLLGGENVVVLNPNEKTIIEGYDVCTLPSYNVGKQFHPKEKGNLAYIITIEGQRIFVAGDSDENPDNNNIKVDIALVPIGGKYTMDYKQAAEYINKIKPTKVIPTHYGSNGIGEIKDGEKFKELIDPSIEVQLLIE